MYHFKMGHELSFLRVGHLAEGLDQLLSFLDDAAARQGLNELLENYRRRAGDPNRGQWIPTLVCHQFQDGVRFELFAVMDDAPPAGYHFWLLWARSDPERDRYDRFDVIVLPTPQMGQASTDNELTRLAWAAVQQRDIRRLLDPFATERLLLPSPLSATALLGLLAQLAQFASRNGFLRQSDNGRGPASLLRDYVQQIATELFKNERGQDLDETARCEITDRVYERLYLKARPGRGFMAPTSADAFRAYIRKAIKGEVANHNRRAKARGQCIASWERELQGGEGRTTARKSVPASVHEAAEQLGVSAATAWRKLNAASGKALTQEQWAAIQEETRSKRLWQQIQDALELQGRNPAAARKQVYRWRQAGLSPTAPASLPGETGELHPGGRGP
jgi:hypothetical protein